MKAYVLSIAGIVLVIAAISIISPSGKMGKFIKGTGRLFILVVMVAPFATLFGEKKDSFFRTEEMSTDESYLLRCAQILSEEDEKEITEYLNETFSITAEVKVFRKDTTGFPREKIEAKITDFGIIGQGGHIDKTEDVRKALEERYGCEAVVS
ncbi:MAG: stage III sporulation protein AF [Clostridia bacterium]|nr:stage III sporulation protein AF [Clostridia bacterium]